MRSSQRGENDLQLKRLSVHNGEQGWPTGERLKLFIIARKICKLSYVSRLLPLHHWIKSNLPPTNVALVRFPAPESYVG